jgi:hypothetical protein
MAQRGGNEEVFKEWEEKYQEAIKWDGSHTWPPPLQSRSGILKDRAASSRPAKSVTPSIHSMKMK